MRVNFFTITVRDHQTDINKKGEKASNVKRTTTKRQKVKGGKTNKTGKKQTLSLNPPKRSKIHAD